MSRRIATSGFWIAARSWLCIVVVVCLHLGFACGARAQDGAAEPPSESSEDQGAEDLARRLLDRDAAAENDDLMSRILRLMNDAQQRLHRRFDPGPETQAVQERVMQGLDDAIMLALQQRSRSTGTTTANGDERRMPQPPKHNQTDENKTEPDSAPGNQAPSPSSATGADAPKSTQAGPFKESRRGWGHLPPRQREEIIQGIAEDVLEGYRELIDRYYRALAETEEP